MQTASCTDKTIQTMDGAAWNDNDDKAIIKKQTPGNHQKGAAGQKFH